MTMNDVIVFFVFQDSDECTGLEIETLVAFSMWMMTAILMTRHDQQHSELLCIHGAISCILAPAYIVSSKGERDGFHERVMHST